MNTNQFFSFRRFSLLFKNDILINHKPYLFTLAGAFIVIYVIFLYNMMNAYMFYNSNSYISVFMMGLVGVGAFVGTAFPELTDKIRTSNYLLQPGSIFEKFLVQFLIRFVICFSLFLLIYYIDAYLAKFTAVRMESVKEKGIVIDNFKMNMILESVKPLRDKFMFVFAFFSFGTFLFTSRLFFRRFALVKSIISGAVLICLFLLGMVLLSHLFFPDITHGFEIQIEQYQIVPGILSTLFLIYLFAFSTWLFLLPLGYFKLKEKQE